MTVTLTPKTEERIQQWIERGRFPDADAVIDEALAALEVVDRERRLKELREFVLAGFNSGEGEELTDELWDEIERSVEERVRRGDEPSPHVCA